MILGRAIHPAVPAPSLENLLKHPVLSAAAQLDSRFEDSAAMKGPGAPLC